MGRKRFGAHVATFILQLKQQEYTKQLTKQHILHKAISKVVDRSVDNLVARLQRELGDLTRGRMRTVFLI